LGKAYDGIIIGAGHHGLVLGSYLAKVGLRIPLVDRRLEYGGGLMTKEVTAPRLLSQPAFDQSFPHLRDALVQGSRA
jgi:phytoene dehydrogenase-like protein